MTVVDPQTLQILEHRQRLLEERLKQNMAKQFDLIQIEAQLRADLLKIESAKYGILKSC